MKVLIFNISFRPIGNKAVSLYSESLKRLTGKSLWEVSTLVANLEDIWEDEAQDFILFVGNSVRGKAESLKQKWIDLSKNWRL